MTSLNYILKEPFDIDQISKCLIDYCEKGTYPKRIVWNPRTLCTILEANPKVSTIALKEFMGMKSFINGDVPENQIRFEG